MFWDTFLNFQVLRKEFFVVLFFNCWRGGRSNGLVMLVNESMQPDLKVNLTVSVVVHSKQSFVGTL